MSIGCKTSRKLVYQNIAELLVQRGISTFELQKHFSPNLRHLHNPFLMKIWILQLTV